MKNYDVVIVGAGPAGITAAIYLQRTNLKIALVERNAPGGRMLQAKKITNYPGISGSGADLAQAMFAMIDFMKVSFIVDEVIKIEKQNSFILILKNETITSDQVILATGFINKPLENTNEEAFIGKGISYCALCDAPLVKDQNILCYANNLKALKEVEYLASLAKYVTLITDEDVKETANMTVLKGAKIIKFIGDYKLRQVAIYNHALEQTIDVSYAFIFNGYIPATSFLKDLKITNALGLIEVDEHLETKIKGLFAIGDVNIKDVKQVATAVGDGAYVASKLVR